MIIWIVVPTSASVWYPISQLDLQRNSGHCESISRQKALSEAQFCAATPPKTINRYREAKQFKLERVP